MSALILDLTNELASFGGKWFAQMTNGAEFLGDVELMRNVKTETALPKLNIDGEPKPYTIDDEYTGNAIRITDRKLVVYQSKWDFGPIDPEVLRNTYLAKVESGALDAQKIPFGMFVTQQLVDSYWAAINDNTVLYGVRNGAGTDAASIFTGFGTILADAITANEIDALVTGAITDANAVVKLDTFHQDMPAYVKRQEMDIFCSWATFEKYRKNYRAEFGYTFDPSKEGEYRLDGKKATLKPRSWMGDSERLIAVPSVKKNLYVGLDSAGVNLYPTIKHNYITTRAMLPIGVQIADLSAVFTNDRT